MSGIGTSQGTRSGRTAARWLPKAAVGALSALLLGGTAAAGSPVEKAPLAAIDPLALTSEMRAFVDARIGRRQTANARLLALQDAIFSPKDGLGVIYGSSATHTAAETLETGTGNCLSFTMLYVALARHLDLNAYFVEVNEVTSWSQRGDIGFSHWHMFAEVEIDNGLVHVDFLPWTDRRYRSRSRIDEQRVRAHYFSNVGAELLAAGEVDRAIEHFDWALELAPDFHPARVNLGVAERRGGRPEIAEALLLAVLEAEPNNSVAAANLASLYVEVGREADARAWLRKRQSFLDRNPFHHFRLGLGALRDDAPDLARAHFKRAIGLHPGEAAFHEQLANAYERLGEGRRARASLRRAVYLTEDPSRRALLEERLLRRAAEPGAA